MFSIRNQKDSERGGLWGRGRGRRTRTSGREDRMGESYRMKQYLDTSFSNTNFESVGKKA